MVADSSQVAEGVLSFELHSPHGQSKYITAVEEQTIDGEGVDMSAGTFANPSVGEGHTDTAIADLGRVLVKELQIIDQVTLCHSYEPLLVRSGSLNLLTTVTAASTPLSAGAVHHKSNVAFDLEQGVDELGGS